MQRIHNIWKILNNIPEINRNEEFQKKNIIIKETHKEFSITNKNIETNKDNLFDNEINNSQNLYFTNKKRGRKKLNDSKNEEKYIIHDKFSHDNIKRKVKTHFHIFIITLLNMKSEKILNNRNKFGKISSSITQNITIEYNQQLFDRKIKDIIIDMSNKFQDKNRNIICLEIVNKRAHPYEEIIQLLNLTYKDMYVNYYLKSTKKTFEGYYHDESYEKHLIKLEKKFGVDYSCTFKYNAESLITFFTTCKKRIRKYKNLNSPTPFFLSNKNNNDKANTNYNNNTKGENIGEFSNSMVSTWTQTNIILSDDEDIF